MSTPNTPPEPDTSNTCTDRPGPFKRVTSLVTWYMPELTGAVASAGAAATVWAPLGAISVALGAWITVDQVNLARERHQARRALTRQHGERAQLDSAEHDGTAHTADDTEASTTETATEPADGEQAEGERPGWEVSA